MKFEKVIACTEKINFVWISKIIGVGKIGPYIYRSVNATQNLSKKLVRTKEPMYAFYCYEELLLQFQFAYVINLNQIQM